MFHSPYYAENVTYTKIHVNFGFLTLGAYTIYGGAGNEWYLGEEPDHATFYPGSVEIISCLPQIHPWLCFRNRNIFFPPTLPPAPLSSFLCYYDWPMALERVVLCGWLPRKVLQRETHSCNRPLLSSPWFLLLPQWNIDVISTTPAVILGNEVNLRMNVKYIVWQSRKRKSTGSWRLTGGSIQIVDCLLLNMFNLWMKLISVMFKLTNKFNNW